LPPLIVSTSFLEFFGCFAREILSARTLRSPLSTSPCSRKEEATGGQDTVERHVEPGPAGTITRYTTTKMIYLDDYVDTMQALPAELAKNFKHIKELDATAQGTRMCPILT
jgi:hypothetical protein